MDLDELLQQASRALSVHDAETLEQLAAEAVRCQVPAGLTDVYLTLEVLRRQIAAASVHLDLRQRLRMQEQPWAR